MDKVYSLLEYEITDEPMENVYARKIPKEIKPQIDKIHDLIFRQPDKAIEPLLDLLHNHPDVPIIRNFLTSAYKMLGETDKAEVFAKENYEKFPDYLFARINYAQSCLSKGELNLIPGIFGHNFELKLLYPRRKKFHISEFLSFMSVMSIYFYGIGEEERSKNYYQLMKMVDKNHPTTKATKRALTPPLSLRIMRKLLGSEKAARMENESLRKRIYKNNEEK